MEFLRNDTTDKLPTPTLIPPVVHLPDETIQTNHEALIYRVFTVFNLLLWGYNLAINNDNDAGALAVNKRYKMSFFRF